VLSFVRTPWPVFLSRPKRSFTLSVPSFPPRCLYKTTKGVDLLGLFPCNFLPNPPTCPKRGSSDTKMPAVVLGPASDWLCMLGINRPLGTFRAVWHKHPTQVFPYSQCLPPLGVFSVLVQCFCPLFFFFPRIRIFAIEPTSKFYPWSRRSPPRFPTHDQKTDSLGFPSSLPFSNSREPCFPLWANSEYL